MADNIKLLEYIRDRIENQSHPYSEEWDGGLCSALGDIEEKVELGYFD
jgi:hypothetical protein